MKDCKDCIFYSKDSITECKLNYKQITFVKEKLKTTPCEINNNDTDTINDILNYQ